MDNQIAIFQDISSVNTVGCWAFTNAALFDFDKAQIKPEAYPMLDEAIILLEKNPAMEVTLQGHTDNVGNAEYNMGLSLRRANAVKTYLIGSLIVSYTDSYSTETVTNEKAKSLIAQLVSIQILETELQSSFVPKLSQVLSPKKVFVYMQIENKIRAAIKYALAAEIPLAE